MAASPFLASCGLAALFTGADSASLAVQRAYAHAELLLGGGGGGDGGGGRGGGGEAEARRQGISSIDN